MNSVLNFFSSCLYRANTDILLHPFFFPTGYVFNAVGCWLVMIIVFLLFITNICDVYVF